MPWTNEIFYYGIVAIDNEGNRGEISNLVAVYIHEETTTTSSTTTTTTTTKKPRLTMQTANRRLGVVGDDEDEVFTGGPSVFRIITGKKTTVIPYVKKPPQATEFRPRVFLPTVRGAHTHTHNAGGGRSSKRTKPPRLTTILDILRFSSKTFSFQPLLEAGNPATIKPNAKFDADRTPGVASRPE